MTGRSNVPAPKQPSVIPAFAGMAVVGVGEAKAFPGSSPLSRMHRTPVSHNSQAYFAPFNSLSKNRNTAASLMQLTFIRIRVDGSCEGENKLPGANT